jgi:hypothetical protein
MPHRPLMLIVLCIVEVFPHPFFFVPALISMHARKHCGSKQVSVTNVSMRRNLGACSTQSDEETSA